MPYYGDHRHFHRAAMRPINKPDELDKLNGSVESMPSTAVEVHLEIVSSMSKFLMTTTGWLF